LAPEAPSASDDEDRLEVTEKTEVIYGAENVLNRGIQGIPLAKETIDLCGEEDGPSAIVANEPILQRYIEASKRGVRIRQITEITKTNILDCKKLMDCMELRHLDGLHGYFVVVDGKEFNSHAYGQDAKSFPHMVSSTVNVFVQQQQFFFETLWNKGIPAEERIREIEEGIQPERTEVISGWQNIFNKHIEIISSRIKERIDVCYDASGAAIIANSGPVLQAGIEFVRKGGKIRFITEITKENIGYVKELMKIQETRHLDGVKGNFSVSEQNYAASAAIDFANQNPRFIFSNSKEIVKQHQYLFEMLWEKAVPAEQKIKEIEEGRPSEKLEIIQDTQKSISRALDIMNKTQKELLVLFATPRTFTIALQSGAADIYRKMSENGVNIKVLVPREGAAEIEENNEQQIAKLREEISPSINLRLSDVNLNTRITIMISDRKEFMSWELRDDILDDPYLAGGIATYSNIKALAGSYAIIFDNLWKITELAESLRIANTKLESNEKAMKEFINIAAHELRTPIQPILGLSEMLPDASTDPQQQRMFLDIIVRNAHKLENLAEDILDVTRIESGKLKLALEKIDLYKLVENVVHDFQRFLPADGKVTMNYQKLSDHGNDDHRMSRLEILGDPERIAQVLSNLLRNALKFTKEGTIDVRVGRKDSRGFSEALVYISDSGHGIDPEVMNKLFEKFTSKSEKGTGLGLFISKSIVKAHGGNIWGENNKDANGATFTFTLPLAT
jgi:two-component system, OmpR family, sensor histidine kinase VicK